MSLRRSVVAFAFAVPFVALTACGGDDLPTKAEFIEQLEGEAKTEFSAAMVEAGVDASVADSLFSDMSGCVYDKIAENEETLQAVFDDSTTAEFDKVMEDKAAPCLSDFQTQLTDAMKDAAAGG